MIKTKQTRVELDNETILHKVRIESDKDDPQHKEIRRQYFLNTIFNTAEMWNCGPGKFDKMTIFYENGGWIVETEYTERLEPENGLRGRSSGFKETS